MRLHISLDDALVEELDELAGTRGRSSYIEASVKERIERDRRWRKIEASFGAIADGGHDWDPDPAAWVRAQRRAGERRIG